MKWKCINDWFGYCSGEPDGASKAQIEERATKVNGIDTIVKMNMGTGATCSLDKKTCGKYMLENQVYPEKVAAPQVTMPTVQESTVVSNNKQEAKVVIIEHEIIEQDLKKENKQPELKLFDEQADWQKEWKDMPEYTQKDLTPYQSIMLHFENKEDMQSFAQLIGQKITQKTKSLWHPAMTPQKLLRKRYKEIQQ